jgi:hypothetical protein
VVEMGVNLNQVLLIVTLLGTVSGSLIWAEDRYAKKIEEVEIKKDTAQLLLDMRIDFTEQRKMDLLIMKKESDDKAAIEDRIKQLDKELDRLYSRKKYY